MSRRTIILIIVLTAITAVLLALALTQRKKVPTTVTPQKPQAQVAYASTTLEISSSPVSSSSQSAKSSYTTDVTIDTGGDKVTAVQLELKYDPKAISNVAMKPGSFFTKPAELIKKVNSKDGTVSYALGINPGEKGVSGTGIAATITYTEIGQTGTYTQINFLPKTLVSAEGNDKSVLKKSIGALIMLGGNKTTTTSVPSVKPAVSGTATPRTTNSPSNPFQ